MTRTWFDPRVPDADRCVLRPLLDRHAAATPDKVFARLRRRNATGPIARRRRSRGGRRSASRALGVAAGRHGPVVAAQRPRRDPRLVRPQLSRRGLRADQPRLSRRAAGACGREFRRAADRGPCRSLSAASADIDRAALTTAVVLGGAAPSMPGLTMHAATRCSRRRRPAAARARDRAVGHADASSTPRARPARRRA